MIRQMLACELTDGVAKSKIWLECAKPPRARRLRLRLRRGRGARACVGLLDVGRSNGIQIFQSDVGKTTRARRLRLRRRLRRGRGARACVGLLVECRSNGIQIFQPVPSHQSRVATHEPPVTSRDSRAPSHQSPVATPEPPVTSRDSRAPSQ